MNHSCDLECGVAAYCIDGKLYGSCDSENCDGFCEAYDDCSCPKHEKGTPHA